MAEKRVSAYLSLGANLGDRKQNLDRALTLLSEHVAIKEGSSVYDTEPVTEDHQPHFLNLVCRISTTLSPEALLSVAKSVEARIGAHRHNQPRPIDIDILLYNDTVMQAASLTIPHPRLTERAFVLVPLAEIAPDVVHPVLHRTVREMLDDLHDRPDVRKWEPGQGEN